METETTTDTADCIFVRSGFVSARQHVSFSIRHAETFSTPPAGKNFRVVRRGLGALRWEWTETKQETLDWIEQNTPEGFVPYHPFKLPEVGKIYRGLRYQIQPTPVTCVHTCLAMLVNRPVDQLVSRLGEAAIGGLELDAFLREEGIVHSYVKPTQISDVGWHLAVVPSLNRIPYNHQVLFHWDAADGLLVLDPSGRERYALDGSDVRGWGDLIRVDPPTLLEIPTHAA